MRAQATRTTAQLLIALALTASMAACGNEKSEDQVGAPKSTASKDSPAPSDSRAQQVADAWEGSKAAEVWLSGYYPMSDAAPPPSGGFHSEDDRVAHMLENYRLRGELPTTAPEKGQVKWRDGETLTLPLLDARQTYTDLDRVTSPTDPQLTVTGAKLGEMTIATSRGPATIPAWLFTLEGYDEPLKRAAFKSSKLPKPPIGSDEDPTTPDGLDELGRLVEVSENGRSVTVVAYHGSCDDGPAVDVLETDGSVVLSASIVGGPTGDEVCTADQRAKEVTVKLDRPLGDRILLDAFMGRPVLYERW